MVDNKANWCHHIGSTTDRQNKRNIIFNVNWRFLLQLYLVASDAENIQHICPKVKKIWVKLVQVKIQLYFSILNCLHKNQKIDLLTKKLWKLCKYVYCVIYSVVRHYPLLCYCTIVPYRSLKRKRLVFFIHGYLYIF